MLLRFILLITLIFVVVHTHKNYPPCDGDCVPYHDCLYLKRYKKVPYCTRTLVCCRGPTTPIYRTRSERACHAYSSDKTFCPEHPLISNGIIANRHELQYMASIGKQSEAEKSPTWICGGTLIHNKFVLTAAHCIQIKRARNTTEPDFFVRLGAHNTTDGYLYKVVAKFFHPGRNISLHTHDIAILQLNKTVIFNEKIKPACLPTSELKNSEILTVSGWGNLDSQLTEAIQLHKASLRVLDVSQCPGGQREMHICAAGVDNISDTCPGDSGGPLAKWHPKWGSCLGQVMGIVSGGGFCSAQTPRTKYTNVFTYLQWIEDIVFNGY